MPIMTWDDSLDIGVHDMNREHRDILDAMNAIYDATQAGKKGQPVIAMINHLGAVTARHFRDEEIFMAKIDYTDLENHKRVHTKLLKDFAMHQAAAVAADGVPTTEFFQFLRLWLAAHIKCIDRKYADYSRAPKGAAGSAR